MVPPDWLTLVVSIFAILELGYLVILLVRRWWLSAAGGLFDCALRPADGGRWKLGLARYQGELLEWYRIWHPWPRPSRLFVRNDTELVALRNSDAEESKLNWATSRIVDIQVKGETPGTWQLALDEGSAVGLVSWLESAPPGQVGYRRVLDS